MTIRFRCNYGDAKQWSDGKQRVYDPAVHRGYHHIVAHGITMGSYAYYIIAQCAKAEADGAPKTVAAYMTDHDAPGYPKPQSWQAGRKTEIKDEIVAALVRYQNELTAGQPERVRG